MVTIQIESSERDIKRPNFGQQLREPVPSLMKLNVNFECKI